MAIQPRNDEASKLTASTVMVGMEAVSREVLASPAPESRGIRRRPSDLTLVSLSDSSTLSLYESSSENNDSIVAPKATRRRKRNNKRKKQRKEPEDLVAKAVAEMNISEKEMKQYLALDCEMVGAGRRGKHSILARVTLVDWNHAVVFDEYVKPTHLITDYRTFVSGITPEILEEKATMTLETVRQKVLDLLDGKILVGHALKNDLRALQIQLPWYATRDTAKYEHFLKARFDDGVLWPQSLKTLAKNRLRRDIQVPGKAHCPIEDAATAMDLYKVARRKWEMAMDYKVKKTLEIEQGGASIKQ